MTILGDSVGANGCSPEEEVLSHAQSRRQKVVGLLTQASQAAPGQSRLRRGQFRLRRANRNAWIRNAVRRRTTLTVSDPPFSEKNIVASSMM
jgi:hypothetical protein